MLVFLGIVLALIIGFMFGFVICTAGNIALDKKAIDDGIVKLDGKYFKLKSLMDTDGE